MFPMKGPMNGPQPAMGGVAPIPGQPQAPAPAAPSSINPMALLSMGQSQLGRALGGNPYDANAMAQMITAGLMGNGGPNLMPQQPRQMPGRTPGFNPAAALGGPPR